MDGIIETLATGLGSTIGWLAESGVLFVVFGALWVGFGIALIGSQPSIDEVWQTIRSWPLIVQILAWILVLPVMAGLWVWETTWPLVLRLVIVLSLAGGNLLILLPRALQGAR
jgi:ABC-type amino acid transport system permease subunit